MMSFQIDLVLSLAGRLVGYWDFSSKWRCIDVVYGHGECQGKIPAGDGGVSCLLMDEVWMKSLKIGILT